MRRGDTVGAAAQTIFVAVRHAHLSDSVGVER